MKLFCEKCSKVVTAENNASAVVKCPQCGSEISLPDSDFAPGVVVGGDFVIENKISAGGMGEVFAARQISLDRPVALKVLQKEFSKDQEYVASLFREARAAARINHPNIVQAYAVGNDGENCYLAMELIRGDTLKNILRKEGTLPTKRAAEIICDVAEALNVAWREQKLVHQDIKPDNIMVDVNGVSKLADLGLAKTATQQEHINGNSDEVLGTPQYISPEQLTGVPTDIRSDIYSLGATFYHIATGKLPYRASDLQELAKMHDAGNLTPPKEVKSDLPDEINRIIIKMMARNISERYQDAASLVVDLKAFLSKADAAKEISPAPPVRPAASPAAAPKPAPPVRPAASPTAVQKPAPPVRPAPPPPVQPVRPAPVPAPAPAAPAPTPVAVPVKVAASKKAENTQSKKGLIALCIAIPLLLAGGGFAGWLMWKDHVTGVETNVVEETQPSTVEETPQPAEEKTAVPEAQAQVVKIALSEPVAMERRPVQTSESTLVMFTATDLSRPEYIKACEDLLEWRNKNQGATENFLQKVDELWPLLRYPETAREMELCSKIMIVFSSIDEQYRCDKSREQLRKEHLAAVERDRIRDEEQKKIDLAREAERKKLQQEIETQASENKRLLQESEQKKRSSLAQLQAEAAALTAACVKAMRESALAADDKAFVQSIMNIKTFVTSQKTFTPDEAKVVKGLKALIPEFEKEYKKMAVLSKRFSVITPKLNFRLLMAAGKGSMLLVKVSPGELVCRGQNNQEIVIKYSQALPRTKQSFANILKRYKIDNARFYLDWYHGVRPQDADVPSSKMWKAIWPVVKNSF